MGGYVKSLIGAKAASIGLQAASLALNAAISMGLSLAISALVSGISKWINKEKEAREQAIETANTAKEEVSNLTELLNKYNQLSEEVKTNASAKDSLLTTQDELLKALGIEQSELDGLISKYGDLSTAINQVALDDLKDNQADLLTGYNAQKEELLKVGKGYAHWYSLTDRNLLSGGSDSVEAFDILEKAGIVSSGEYGSGGGIFALDGDDSTVEGILENYAKLKSAQEALDQAIADGTFTKEELSENSLYNAIASKEQELRKYVDNYNSAIDDSNENSANQQIISDLMGRELPKDAEEFETFKQSLIDTAQASNNFIGTQEDIKDSVINALAEMPEFSKYFDDLNDAQSSTSNTVDLLSFSEVFNSDDFSSTAKELKELSLAGTLSPETLSSTEEYNTLLTQTGLSADVVAEKIREIALSETTLSDIMSTMKGHAELINNVNDDISDSGKISADTLQSIANTYPQLESYITDYLSGVEGAQDTLVSELGKLYETDIDNCKEYYRIKWSNSESYWDNFVANSLYSQVTELAKQYGLDLSNFKSYAIAKAEIANKLYEAQDLATKIETNQSTPYSSLMGRVGLLDNDPITQKMNTAKTEAEKKASDLQNVLNALKDGFNADLDYGTSGFNSDNFSPSSLDTSSSSSDSSSSSEKDFDWVETKISRLERRISDLKTVADSAYETFSTRNYALTQEISSVSNEIGLQQQAYARYMEQANAVGLSSSYQNLVKNGTIDISTISDDTLAQQISDFQSWYEKALDCEDAISDLNTQLSELAHQRFDLVSEDFENQLSAIQHNTEMLNGYLDQAEAKGYMISSEFYNQLYKSENINNQSLKNEQSALINALNSAVNSGQIEKYTSDWYDLCNEIDDVTSAIQESDTQLIEFLNDAREADWTQFEYLQDLISNITTEADFLIDLLSNKELSGDSGLTDEGNAVMGLHAVNYNTYMEEADKYASKIEEINKELANDPYNETLLEKKQEYVEAQQDAILAAEDEKQSMIDLAKDGYDAEKNTIDDLIDKYKELLQTRKDDYDYQKTVKEKTDTINSLNKQLMAYSGNTSEEVKSTIQKIQVDLKSAKDDLAETQYDQYIEFQENLLDDLSDEYETFIEEKLAAIDDTIEELINQVNLDSESISDTIASAAEDVGYTLSDSMTSIWETNATTLGNIVKFYGDVENSNMTALKSTIASINTYVSSMAESAKSAADAAAAKAATSSVSNPNTTTSSSSPSSSSSNSSASSSSSNTASSSTWGSWFISKRDSYDKSKLKVDSSIVDRLKYRDVDSSFSARSGYYSAMGGAGTYTGSSSQNQWMIQQMKAHGFSKGGFGELVKSTGEDGMAIIKRTEGIMPENIVPQWNQLIDSLPQLNTIVNSLPEINLPDFTNFRTSYSTPSIDISIDEINLPNVLDPKDFADNLVNAVKNDRRSQKVLQGATIDLLAGKSIMDIKKY